MIAKCIANSISSIADSTVSQQLRQHVHMDEVGLVVGDLYIVFGVTFCDGIPWFLVCEDIDDGYPTPHCSVFFELVDPRVFEDWCVSFGPSNVVREGGVAILPQVWASDSRFLERLIDGDATAIALFEELKRRYGSRR